MLPGTSGDWSLTLIRPDRQTEVSRLARVTLRPTLHLMASSLAGRVCVTSPVSRKTFSRGATLIDTSCTQPLSEGKGARGRGKGREGWRGGGKEGNCSDLGSGALIKALGEPLTALTRDWRPQLSSAHSTCICACSLTRPFDEAQQ